MGDRGCRRLVTQSQDARIWARHTRRFVVPRPKRLDTRYQPPDRGTVVHLSSAQRPPRGGVLLLISVVIMASASIATHMAGGADMSGEPPEHAEHVAVPTVVGPIGALLLLGALWLLRGRVLRPTWFFVLPPAAYVIQELTERLTQAPAAEPGPLATGLTQVAFAVLAFVLARVLLGVVRRVVRFLRVASHRGRHPVPAFGWPPAFAQIAKLPAPAGAHLGRAPPYLA